MIADQRNKLQFQERAASDLLRSLEQYDADDAPVGQLRSTGATYSVKHERRGRRYVRGVGAQSLAKKLRRLVLTHAIDFDICNTLLVMDCCF